MEDEDTRHSWVKLILPFEIHAIQSFQKSELKTMRGHKSCIYMNQVWPEAKEKQKEQERKF